MPHPILMVMIRSRTRALQPFASNSMNVAHNQEAAQIIIRTPDNPPNTASAPPRAFVNWTILRCMGGA